MSNISLICVQAEGNKKAARAAVSQNSLAILYPIGYYDYMNTITATEEFSTWVDGLTDLTARAAIYLRIRRAEQGNFGEYKVLEDGVSEMKINVGQGYRVYFAREGRVTYLLLCGGDKSTQKADIKRAKAMWKAIKDQT
ncbi:type II toxin-antitoxin system RelE/ParE family toxin [Mycetohabitans sp. B8]|uniref:type II toxin-antitoxin system RelE/ParE family toxin n=2 Tax=unclassified Mycetohabitans TaxID=2622646 RepID=UPI001F2F7457|nr:type II toxin-antitoxin system RelE/ParE family toxin [Mycetohabitans sp. B8]